MSELVSWPEFLEYETVNIRIFKLDNAIRQMGFEPADSSGNASGYRCYNVYNHSLMGLLDNSTKNIETGFWGRVKKIRRDFVGILTFDPMGNNPWTIYVYGRNNISRLKPLSEELAKAYNKKVQLMLDRETVDKEKFSSDFEW